MPRGIYHRQPWMRNHRRLTPEMRQKILRARAAGFAMWAIAESIGMSRTTVSTVLKEAAMEAAQ